MKIQSDSSMFSSYEYNEDKWTLAFTFKDTGKFIKYKDFPPDVYDDMQKAESLGRFYNANIKGQFPTVHDDEVPVEAYEPQPVKTVESGITDEDIAAVERAWAEQGFVPQPAATVVQDVRNQQVSLAAPVAEVPKSEPEILSPDQAVAALSPKSPKLDALTTRLHELAAVKIEVSDKVSQEAMEDHLVVLTGARKAVFEIVDPYREIAYRAYEQVQKLNKSRLDPADVAIASGKTVLKTYLVAEQQKALIEQRRLQAIADAEAEEDRKRRTEALRMRIASEQAEAGDPLQAEATLFDDTIQAPSMPAYVPRMYDEGPKSDLGSRKNWKVKEVYDFDAFVLDVAEGIKHLREKGNLGGHAPVATLQADLPKLNKLASANETENLYPGVRAFNDIVISTTKKKAR